VGDGLGADGRAYWLCEKPFVRTKILNSKLKIFADKKEKTSCQLCTT